MKFLLMGRYSSVLESRYKVVNYISSVLCYKKLTLVSSVSVDVFQCEVSFDCT